MIEYTTLALAFGLWQYYDDVRTVLSLRELLPPKRYQQAHFNHNVAGITSGLSVDCDILSDLVFAY